MTNRQRPKYEEPKQSGSGVRLRLMRIIVQKLVRWYDVFGRFVNIKSCDHRVVPGSRRVHLKVTLIAEWWLVDSILMTLLSIIHKASNHNSNGIHMQVCHDERQVVMAAHNRELVCSCHGVSLISLITACWKAERDLLSVQTGQQPVLFRILFCRRHSELAGAY